MRNDLLETVNRSPGQLVEIVVHRFDERMFLVDRNVAVEVQRHGPTGATDVPKLRPAGERLAVHARTGIARSHTGKRRDGDGVTPERQRRVTYQREGR